MSVAAGAGVISRKYSGRQRVGLLLVILAAVAFGGVATALGVLYRAALEQTRQRLREYVQSQARLFEVVAAHELEYGHFIPAGAGHGVALEATLGQFADAHALFSGAGRTGEFKLARRDGDSIEYLLRHRGAEAATVRRLAWAGVEGAPMKRALSGLSGTMVGLDYRGARVVAAYEPVAAFDLGAVAKMDLAEVQSPFLRAGLVSAALTLALVLLGALLFLRVTNPVLAELAESERRFREVFEHQPEYCYLASPDGIIIDANRAAREALGYERAELVGRHAAEFFAEESRMAVRRTLGQSVGAGPAATGELAIVTKAGARREVQLSICWVRDERDRLVQSILVLQDITESKRAAEAMRRHAEANAFLLKLHEQEQSWSDQEMYEFVVEEAVRLTGSEIGFLHRIGDDEKTVMLTAWNRQALRSCTVVRDDHYPVERAGNWLDCLRQRRPVIYNDYASSPNRKGLPEGHVPVRRFMSVPVIDAGKVRIVFGVGNRAEPYTEQDAVRLQVIGNGLWRIAERRAAEAERQRLTRELTLRRDELEQLIYAASHDLRSPLVAVEGFAGELRRSVAELEAALARAGVHPATVAGPKQDIAEELRYIEAGVGRMSLLLSGLLRLSRLGRADVQVEELDMAGLLRRLLGSAEFAPRFADARFEVGELPAARGDAALVEQIFGNLLDNAVKYRSPARPLMVRITGRREGGEVEYCVEDNGLGIEPELQARVFEPFYRVDPRSGSGDGLGLTIVRRILVRLDGRVRVESEKGRGSRFYVTLPGGAAPANTETVRRMA